MKFILVLFYIGYHDSGALATAEFDNLAACKKAGYETTTFRPFDNDNGIRYVCEPKEVKND
jgi:hypothetical protein